MNNAEFVAHVRNETDEKPLTTELNFLRGALDRLESAEQRIEELENNHGKGKCAKILPPKKRPDFFIDPEEQP